MKVIQAIFKFLGNLTLAFLSSLMSAVSSYFKYANNKLEHDKEEQRKKEDKKFNDKINDVVDNGDLDDLLDLKRKVDS